MTTATAAAPPRPVRTAAKAIIVVDGRLLVVQGVDENGPWHALPGGGQLPGEPLHETICRECREEIGADVTVGPLVFVRDYIACNHEFADRLPDFHQVECLFRCTLANDADLERVGSAVGPLPDPNQTGVAWLALDELERHRLYPAVLRSLLAAANGANGADECAPAPVYLGDVN